MDKIVSKFSWVILGALIIGWISIVLMQYEAFRVEKQLESLQGIDIGFLNIDHNTMPTSAYTREFAGEFNHEFFNSISRKNLVIENYNEKFWLKNRRNYFNQQYKSIRKEAKFQPSIDSCILIYGLYDYYGSSFDVTIKSTIIKKGLKEHEVFFSQARSFPGDTRSIKEISETISENLYQVLLNLNLED